MSETVVTAIISGLCVAIPAVVATIANNKTARTKNQEEGELTRYKIEELTKKVEKHNQVIERVYKLEQADAVHNEEIKVANHRISDLERKVG